MTLGLAPVDAGLVVLQRPLPAMSTLLPVQPGPYSAYFGISIDAAVNLLEAREYTGLDRSTRLHTALTEQQQMLGGLLSYAGRAAFDLRLETDAQAPGTLRLTLLGRVWASTPEEAGKLGGSMRAQVKSLLPRHVTTSEIWDSARLHRLLDPYPETPIQSAVVTKRELVEIPNRADAGLPKYFSVVPFTWGDVDWTTFYEALVASRAPLTVAVGLFPVVAPAWVGESLNWWATYYARLAREDSTRSGLYYAGQKIPPEAFAVDAERVFADAHRRYSQSAFVLRIQVAGPEVTPGIVAALGAVVAPPEAGAGSHLDRGRAAATHEVRWLTGERGERVGRWNLAALDCFSAPARPEVRQSFPQLPANHALGLLSMLGDATDAACAFRLPVAFAGVVPGFPVRRGSFGHAEAYTDDGPSVLIGHLSGRSTPLTLPVAALTKHTLVVGSPGSGKSTTVLELLANLWREHQVPFLVVEPVNAEHDDYRKLASVAGMELLRVITVGDETGVPLRFNPFEVPAGVLVAEHIANLLACFKAAFGLWEPLPSIYQDALDGTYLSAGVLSSEVADDQPLRWPTAVEFVLAMEKATSNLGYAGEVKANIEAASIRRAQQLVTGTSATTFLTDQRLDIAALMSGPVVLELKSLGSGDEQSLMMALLLNAMTEHYKAARKPTGKLQHLTVIEEAHRLLARPSGGSNPEQAQAKERAAAEFANTLAENRKYGEGMVIAEQVPVKLVEDAVKNTNLKIMHRLTAEEDRQYVGRSMGLDEPQERFATRLRTGEALTYSDAFAEAVHVDIHRTITAPPPALERQARPPFDGCAPCRAKCLYRGAALAIMRDPETHEKLSAARRATSEPEADAEMVRARWSEFVRLLRVSVTRFRALPSQGPDVDDAAFCLFLHSIAVDTMMYAPEWPTAVAERLGILGADPVG